MQIERLVQMIFHIVYREHVTAKELADYFNVSTRTIYRDINILSVAGIPIISTKGAGGGITTINGYTIDKSFLSEEEQQNIYHGLQILQATKYPNAEIALSKIGTIFRNVSQPRWLEVDFSYWGSDEEQKISISELQYAIINKHRIKFVYFNSELQQSNRTVEPLRLVFKSSTWYIVGYCCSKKDIRIFRMSRIKDIQVMPEIFKRELPKDYTLTGEYQDTENIHIFKLKFKPEIAVRLYDEFQEKQVSRCQDGDYLVTVQYPLSTWTFNRLLSYGKYVEVIEPEIARMMLKERVLEIAKIY